MTASIIGFLVCILAYEMARYLAVRAARKVTRAGHAARSRIVSTAVRARKSWQDWRALRERKAVRRRERDQRLLVEAQRELAAVIASQREELAVLRERLERDEPDAGMTIALPAQSWRWNRPS